MLKYANTSDQELMSLGVAASIFGWLVPEYHIFMNICIQSEAKLPKVTMNKLIETDRSICY
jgi:hypothetical protein